MKEVSIDNYMEALQLSFAESPYCDCLRTLGVSIMTLSNISNYVAKITYWETSGKAVTSCSLRLSYEDTHLGYVDVKFVISDFYGDDILFIDSWEVQK